MTYTKEERASMAATITPGQHYVVHSYGYNEDGALTGWFTNVGEWHGPLHDHAGFWEQRELAKGMTQARYVKRRATLRKWNSDMHAAAEIIKAAGGTVDLFPFIDP